MSSAATPITGTFSSSRRSSRYSDRNVILRARSPVMPNTTRASDSRSLMAGNLALGSRSRGLTPRAQLLGQRHVLGRGTAVVASGLEHARQLLEPGFGDEHGATLLSELTFAHDRVAIAVGSEPDDRIVDVQGAKSIAPDRSVEIVDDPGQRVASPHVVTRREQMAGVEADAKAIAAAGGVDQLRELLERAPERAAGSRRVLEQER